MSDQQIDDILYQISYYPKKRLELFLSLSHQRRRNVILRLSKYLQYEIISKLRHEDLVSVLEHLDTDEATDILQLLPPKKRKVIINELNEQLKSDISLLLQFDPETAAGLMNIDYIQVEFDDTISSVAKQVKVHETRTGRLPAILVMKEGELLGYLPGHQLGLANPKHQVLKYVKKIKSVRYNTKKNDVLDFFRDNPNNKIVVLGKTGNVMGIIYSDDVLRILHQQEAASLYDFAGVSQEESVYDSAQRKIKFRYKWLIINLATAFLASFTVSLFDSTISKYVLLAVYMPIVAGMGGNSATQTLAVLVRGISLKQITLGTMWRTLKNELIAGFVNGLINGFIIIGIVLLKDGDWKIALILAVAMIINLLVASFFGTIVPLLMKKLGKDPASSATIFITTATDVLGFMAFLGLATIFLG